MIAAERAHLISESELRNSVFLPGFTTADRVTNLNLASSARQLREADFDAVVASTRTALAEDPNFRGTSGTLRQIEPVLDVTAPDYEGLKTLAAVRETHPALPVIMFSRLTERGSQTTLDALQLGATDYVTKPASSADLERCIQGELTRKIKTLATVAIRVGVAAGVAQQTLGSRDKAPAVGQAVPDSMARPDSMTGHRQAQPDLPHQCLSKPTSPAQQALSSRPAIRTAEIVAIATSTGGPNALASLLSSLPPSFLTPIVVVQHMASGFTATLAESLRRQTGRNVREVENDQPLDAAEVWIAPDGRHLVLTHRGRTIQVASHDAPPENGCCPSADVLFRSVVDVFGSPCLAVVLTGMGCDGLAGCRAIRQAGGTILVQDEASSIAWGMPGQVATAGLADDVLPLTDLAQEICRRTVHTPAWRAGRHPPPNEAALPNL